MASTSTNQRSIDKNSRPQNEVDSKQILPEEAFRRMISLERKRSERSQRPFVLLLIDTGRSQPGDKQGRVLLDMLSALQGATRETDITGWYTMNSVVGVMFTEIVLDNNAVLSTILSRVGELLRQKLDTDQFSRIKFSFHVFPDDWDSQDPERPSNPTLYPDLEKRQESNRLGRAIKRMIDVLGSLSLLAILSPVFLIIAAAVKLTSRGPVLFQQKRIGEQCGMDSADPAALGDPCFEGRGFQRVQRRCRILRQLSASISKTRLHPSKLQYHQRNMNDPE